MATAIIVRTDGTVEDFNGTLAFDAVREAMNIGYIEHVHLSEDIAAMVDEEGVYNGAVPNIVASAVLNILGYPMEYMPGGFILGNVLFFGGIVGDSEAPLGAAQEARLRDILNTVKRMLG